jgi:NagD protein
MTAVVCDIDGVILSDDEALPGARAFLEELEARRIEHVFLTNYPSETPAGLKERFLRAGLFVSEDHFYTSALATAEFLDGQAGARRRAYVVGDQALRDALAEVGFEEADEDVEFVVLGETPSYSLAMIQKAALLIKAGARFVATNPDVAGPLGRPACGALAAPIERITGRRPFFVGKPSAIMMRGALKHIGAHSGETLMVGDNMETDIMAGLQSGMRTILVLSGVSQREDLVRFAYRPHLIVDGLDEILPLLSI